MQVKHPIKPLIAASIGNALEWYDFGLYGYLAITMQEIFFPFESSVRGLLFVFLVFGMGLFMRPIGGIIFAYIGDKIGRKVALVASIATMAVPTFIMGFLPSYQQAGMLSLYLLVVIRLLQGMAVGGEMIGSVVFLVEYAPPLKRGLSASLVYSVGSIGALLGSLSGALLHTVFSQETILAWAWRLPFLMGIVVGGVGLYIRLKISETPIFYKLLQASRTAKFPFSEALRKHYKEILKIFVLTSLQATGFYLPFVYLTTWLTREAHFSSSSSFILNSLGIVFLILLIPVFAALSDRIGRRKILMVGALSTCVIVYPLLKLLAHVSSSSSPFLVAFLVIFLFATVTALYQGPLPAALSEMLDTRNRYMSLVIGYNSSAAFFGGITPFLSTYLIAATGNHQAPCFLLIITGACAFLVLHFFVKETYKLPLK